MINHCLLIVTLDRKDHTYFCKTCYNPSFHTVRLICKTFNLAAIESMDS